MLGALKGLPAVLSGEMKDTAQLNAFAVYGLEKFLGKDERCEIFRSMPGASSMLPKGKFPFLFLEQCHLLKKLEFQRW